MKLLNQSLRYSASDLVNYMGCRHLTELDRSAALGNIPEPDWRNPSLDLIQQKGLEHERAYVESLKAKGMSVCEMEGRSADETCQAIQKGYDIITQARFEKDGWIGIADILRRVEGESSLGDWHYEVEDTKLARETKAGTVLQLCMYSELLGELQNRVPEHMHVIKPGEGFAMETYRYPEFEAYYRTVKDRFREWMEAGPVQTYPMPVVKCDTCRWWKECNRKWHEDDHLSLVAGIRSQQIKELEQQGIGSLAMYAREPQPFRRKPGQGSEETFQRIHDQARVQFKGREAGKLIYELLTFEQNRGLNRLPKPSPGDIYFDIEGDHFYEEGGMEYLFGVIYRNESGQVETISLWARNRAEERKIFSEFMQFVINRWEQYPDMHIYHYAPYEPTAVKKLASRTAQFELEVDRLLRSGRFVDLHSILRETMIASVESYSLKEMESFTDYTREADLRLASEARRQMSIALDFNDFSAFADSDFALIEAYNKDDCLATRALHEWLESIYRGQLAGGVQLTRPGDSTGEAPEKVAEEEEQAQALIEALTRELPEDPENWGNEDQSRWLLAHQVGFYRREMKSAFWEFYRLQDLEPAELVEERKGIAGLKFLVTISGSGSVPVDRYSFPPQEVSMEKGNELYQVLGEKIGSVHDFSLQKRTVDIKKMRRTAHIHPSAVFINEIVPNKPLIPSFFAFIQSAVTHGMDGDGPFRAGRDLLLKKPPRMSGNADFVFREGEDLESSAINLVLALERGTLPVQGPPGTGKTYLGAGLIAELVKHGKRIGVTAVSHKVIRNLLDRSYDRGREKGIPVTIRHKAKAEDADARKEEIFLNDKNEAMNALDQGFVVGGTAWLWADDLFEETLDYLFVDEAGQMSLAQVLTISRAAKNLILLGDPQQLEQPKKGAHPERSDISALEHILDGHRTMPAEKGIFLGTTWRLHPSINHFTSTLYYEGRLKPIKELINQKIVGGSSFAGSGLIYVPVEHSGNQAQSGEEVEAISGIVGNLINSGLCWTDMDDVSHPLEEKDILIIAPYNAQVSALKQALPEYPIGTVDKFQGQQTPAVIYSMTSSSSQDAPRGMSFLYNPNRMNVATSRARCISILVSSPRLFEVECNTIEQMRWANGFCLYKEMAREVDPA